jgi:tricorn protease
MAPCTPRLIRLLASLLIILSLVSTSSAQPDTSDTRLLQMPAVSKEHIAFVYAGDVWVCNLDGKNVRRLTTGLPPNGAPSPCFSPDGRTLAYSGKVKGNTDVYTVTVEGGQPNRLTWHPDDDHVHGWAADGSAVLFVSNRAYSGAREGPHAYAVPIRGGFPARLPMPRVYAMSLSPDGGRVAYTQQYEVTSRWKGYRGGMASRIRIMRLADLAEVAIPQPQGGCNDHDPCWMDDVIYFRSDRSGELNLFCYDTRTKAVEQLTEFKDFPIASVSAGGGNVVFEQAGYLHRFDVAARRSHRLKIGVTCELPETKGRVIKGPSSLYPRSSSVSPKGDKVALECRGEVVIVTTAALPPHNLTQTPGAHERTPVWSPDGKSVAYFSDAGGEYQLHIRPADGSGPAKVYSLTGMGFYEYAAWSPDGQKLVYVDHSFTLYWIDLGSGAVKKVAAEPNSGTAFAWQRSRPSWSPDSRWIAYALGNHSYYRSVYLYSLAQDKSYAVTDGMADVTQPVFDAGGQYLYFTASTDSGPTNHFHNLSSLDMRATRSLYVALLSKETPSPFNTMKVGQAVTQPETKGAGVVRVDLDSLDRRILVFPLAAGQFHTLRSGAPGQVLYLASGGRLMRYDLAKRQEEALAQGVSSFQPTDGGRKALVTLSSGGLSVIDLVSGADLAKSRLNLDAVEVRIEPRAEWSQIFYESWRVIRDYCYDPAMHGLDWVAVRKKYEPFLQHLASAADLYRVILAMVSEVGASHSRVIPGNRFGSGSRANVGLLGADYEVVHGRYRFKRVIPPQPWWPGADAPLVGPGVEVKAGEYLLTVSGKPLLPPASVYAAFEGTAGQSVEITVGPSPDGVGARTLTVRPLGSEHALRHADGIESTRRRVSEATGGRIGYVYLPNTSDLGHSYFKRLFYAQLDKEALILDARGNDGGHTADYIVDHLRRPFSHNLSYRYGSDEHWPSAAIKGPKAMLIDEFAGSGGDLLPYLFRHYQVGPLIGKRTGGGVAGINGLPMLMDGSHVTIPGFRPWTPAAGWIIENEGVAPDIEVEQRPADLFAGKDTQLEKALEVVLKELERTPRPQPRRPPYPVRVR